MKLNGKDQLRTALRGTSTERVQKSKHNHNKLNGTEQKKRCEGSSGPELFFYLLFFKIKDKILFLGRHIHTRRTPVLHCMFSSSPLHVLHEKAVFLCCYIISSLLVRSRSSKPGLFVLFVANKKNCHKKNWLCARWLSFYLALRWSSNLACEEH